MGQKAHGACRFLISVSLTYGHAASAADHSGLDVQEERTARGYFESSILDADPSQNEAYTNRIKCLKHNARASVVLQHQQLQQSFLLADVVGATVAGLAMCLAIGGIYICYRFSK